VISFRSIDVKWAKLFDDKLNGTARCIRLAAPLMRQRRWGRIINVLGGAARQPQPAAVSVGLNNAAFQPDQGARGRSGPRQRAPSTL